MKIVNLLLEVPRNALRADKQLDGTWLVYELGDALPIEPVVPVSRVLSAQEFRDLFTPAELTAIVASTDANVRVLLYKISTNLDGINMGSADVASGLSLLVSLGLLAVARRTAMLA